MARSVREQSLWDDEANDGLGSIETQVQHVVLSFLRDTALALIIETGRRRHLAVGQP